MPQCKGVHRANNPVKVFKIENKLESVEAKSTSMNDKKDEEDLEDPCKQTQELNLKVSSIVGPHYIHGDINKTR